MQGLCGYWKSLVHDRAVWDLLLSQLMCCLCRSAKVWSRGYQSSVLGVDVVRPGVSDAIMLPGAAAGVATSCLFVSLGAHHSASHNGNPSGFV